MSENKKAKISDNPTAKEMKDVLPLVKAAGGAFGILGRLGINKEKFGELGAMAADLAEQSKIIELPDRFNELFGPKGWVCVGSALSVTLMQEAIALAETGKEEEAEQAIVDWFTKETIELFAITRARRFHQAILRDDQLREALNLYLEERYMAAVPLILIACDGFASDISGVSPFAEKADLTVYDSITGHATGLPSMIGLLVKGAYKSRDDEVTMPERHKIIHGRALGYANKTVCAKAWLLMIALVDWAIDKSSEDERKAEAERKANHSLSDSLKQLQKTQADKRAIGAFEPHSLDGPFDEEFGADTPEKAVNEFLSGWKSKNYGKMGKYAVNLTKKPVNKMAGEMRTMAEFVELEQFEFRKIQYSTIARCDARVWVKAKTLRETVEGELDLLIIRYTEDGDMAMPNDSNCTWTVQQLCIYNVMNAKFVGKEL
ncbi:MAG: hypothetical protein ABJN34_08960 [Litoreibacter sp.]|uniref:hypothetical protein n=1 Tax=Litoreibacter sp. TaxID=1969459 RepID=UPI003298C3F8